LAISFDSCQDFNDRAARSLASGFPSSLQDLDLDFNGCSALSDDGVESLAAALPQYLRKLKLDLSGCRFGDAGMKALGASLGRQGCSPECDGPGIVKGHDPYCADSIDPFEIVFSLADEAWELVPLLHKTSGSAAASGESLEPDNQSLSWDPHTSRRPIKTAMEDLSLSFAGCGQLSEAAMMAVIQALPQQLKRLALNFYGCITLGDSSLQALAAALPPTLLYFELRVARCPSISDVGVQALAKKLPPALAHLVLDVRYCTELTDASASAIAGGLPTTIKQFETDFVSCSNVTCATEEILQQAAATRRGSKLLFWGKDDFGVNM